MTRTLLIVLTFCGAWPAAAAEKITKETLATGGEQRIYYLFVPESVGENLPRSSSRCTVPGVTAGSSSNTGRRSRNEKASSWRDRTRATARAGA